MILKSILFSSGLILGVATTFFLISKDPVETKAPQNLQIAESVQIKEAELLQSEISELEEIVDQRDEEILRLEEQLIESVAENNERKERKEERKQSIMPLIKERMASRLNSQISSLTSNITMSGPQRQQVETFMRNQQEMKMKIKELYYNKEWTEEREAEIRNEYSDMKLGDYLNQVLDKEQLTEYSDYIDEQNEVRLEATASRELSKLVSIVNLTENQKNEAYSAIFNNEKNNINPDELLKNRHHRSSTNTDTLIIELANILTPEQLEAYSNDIRAEEAMMNSWRKQGSKGRGQ